MLEQHTIIFFFFPKKKLCHLSTGYPHHALSDAVYHLVTGQRICHGTSLLATNFTRKQGKRVCTQNKESLGRQRMIELTMPSSQPFSIHELRNRGEQKLSSSSQSGPADMSLLSTFVCTKVSLFVED